MLLVPVRRDPGLQRRRREMVPDRVCPLHADRLANLDVRQAPQLANVTCANSAPAHPRAVLEDTDPGDLVLVVYAIAHMQGTGEHPHVRDLLAVGTSLNLEDAA